MALLIPDGLFIHVPKTGGTWVRAAIAAAGIPNHESGPFEIEDHYGVPDFKHANRLDLLSRFSFGFVRNPVAWLKSRWAWAVLSDFPAKIPVEPAAAAHWMASCWSDCFEEFVAKSLDACPGICTATCLGKLGWRCAAGRWIDPAHAVRFIGRHEMLADHLIMALELSGQSFDRAKILTTPRQRVAASGELASQTTISPFLRSRVLKAEHQLCDIFGYD
jgi:hypothetical protein